MKKEVDVKAVKENFRKRFDEIFETILGVYQIAKDEGIFSYLAADKLAERRLNSVHGLVRTWPQWPRKG